MCKDMDACCCCIPLKTGTIIILVLNLVGYAVSFATSMGNAIAITWACLGVLVSILALVGVVQNNRTLLMIYFWWVLIAMLLFIGVAITTIVAFGVACAATYDAAHQTVDMQTGAITNTGNADERAQWASACALIPTIAFGIAAAIYLPLEIHFMCVVRSYAHSLSPDTVSTWL